MAAIPNGVNQQNVGDHATIEISGESRLLAASIKGKLDGMSPSTLGKSCCIYKVPDKFRKINEFAYTPEMISIGPFHRDKVPIQAMEEYKLRYMNALLSRLDDQVAKLEECVEAITRLEDEARKSYSKPVEPDKKKFIEMMIVDGLFIIELFRKSAGEERTYRDDPFFTKVWAMSSLLRDMILLENQIPMFVLQGLFGIVMANRTAGKSLSELTIRFFDPLMQREERAYENHVNIEGKHLLDLLLHTFYDGLPQTDKYDGLPQTDEADDIKLKHVPCVTELRQTGIRFKKGNTTRSFLDIRYAIRVMKIPPIHIHDQTDSFLRNFIAFEQCCDGRFTYMTSYALLMKSLIKSAEDVKILRNHGIITNHLDNDECVASLFNKLCNEVTHVDCFYSKLRYDVNEFYEKWLPWTEQKIILKRDYFPNPWKAVSLFAACLIILLTLWSSLFAGFSYFIHKS